MPVADLMHLSWRMLYTIEAAHGDLADESRSARGD